MRFLLTEMDVHVTVKLNPTLLGREAVDGLLHDVLGYHEIADARRRTSTRTCSGARRWRSPTASPSWRARWAARFQVKFSNTLVVRNHRSFFPAVRGGDVPLRRAAARDHAEPGREVPARPGPTCRSRSRRAWTTRTSPTASPSASRPSRPAPTCCGPGGYGRLPRYLDRLEERMRALGVRAHRRLRDQGARARARRRCAPRVPAGPAARRARRVALVRARGPRGRCSTAAGRRLYEPWSTRAAVLNTPALVARPPPTRATAPTQNRAVPRKIGSHLWLFDCINCDKCVPVCPNDANFVYETGARSAPATSTTRRAGGRGRGACPAGVFEVTKAHQIANFQDFCNECGNCDIFCPEDGGPYIEKPRFFGSLDAWRPLPDARRLLRLRGGRRGRRSGRASAGAEYHARGGPRRATAASSPTA